MTTEASQTFGSLLRQFRRAAGLSQEALAERAGLSPRAIRALEGGERRAPYPHTIGQLARALRLSPSDRARLTAMVEARAEPTMPLTAESNPSPALTRFVGRERELTEVRRLLADTRLLTLIGAGGIGKTRLALEAARAFAAEGADDIWLIQLAALTDGAFVPQAVASVLGVTEQSGTSLTETLARRLAQRQVLLVLDNCEHLIDASATLAEALLTACPGLRLLATSRQPLGIGGETTWRVPSLTLPIRDDQSNMRASVRHSEAGRLFIDRAAAALPEWQLTDANASAVVAICWALDGIPLALELAAARLRALPIEQLAARIDASMSLLTGGSRTALPRQRTLRATIDWSYHLLTEPERALLRHLSVFAGGWTLEAVEAVCVEPDGDGETIALLAQLVDKSLAVLEASPESAARYRLLEPVRQYAAERLREAGEEAAAKERHRAWCLTLAERAAPELIGADQVAWFARLDAEHDNLRAALGWCIERAPEAGLQLAAHLVQYWRVHCHYAEGRHWLEELLNQAPAPTALRATALLDVGVLAYFGQGDADVGRFQCEAGLALARAVGDQRLIAHGRSVLGRLLFHLGEYARARELLENGLDHARASGERYNLGTSLLMLCQLSEAIGDYRRARTLGEESEAVLRATGETWLISNTFDALARIALAEGDGARAERWLDEARHASERLPTPRMLANMEELAGRAAYWRGDLAAAATHFAAGLAYARETGDHYQAGWALAGLGQVARLRGEPDQASVLLEESRALFEAQGYRRGVGVALHHLGRAAWDQGDDRKASEWLRSSLALRWELGERSGVAECLEGLAAVAAGRGAPERAARLLGAAEAMRTSLGAPLPPVERPAHDATMRLIGATLIGSLAAAAMAAGRALPVEQVVVEALDDQNYPLRTTLRSINQPH